MIILPPKEIQEYITLNEKEEWIYDETMPVELVSVFNEFVKTVKDADKHKQSMMKY